MAKGYSYYGSICKKEAHRIVIVIQNHNDLLTPEEVGKLLHLSDRAVRNYRMEGRLLSSKINEKKHLFFRQDIENILTEGLYAE